MTAVGISIGGLLVHNLTEFPLSILLGPGTLVPVAITILLGVAMLRWPGRYVYVATTGWALVVIVGGGGSVLPLSALPFVPEQTVGHYLVHSSRCNILLIESFNKVKKATFGYSPGSSTTPSCWRRPRTSSWNQSSFRLPFSNRSIAIPDTSTVFPVGGMPISSPS